MATTIRGIYKGFKFISHLFVVKEREMEIGSPTDVKHLAHIGLDGPDGCTPSWMNEFKTGPASVGSLGGSRDPTWSSQDFEQSIGRQRASETYNSLPSTKIPSRSQKQWLKKGISSSSSKSDTSPKSNSSRSLRISRKSTLREREESGNMYV